MGIPVQPTVLCGECGDGGGQRRPCHTDGGEQQGVTRRCSRPQRRGCLSTFALLFKDLLLVARASESQLSQFSLGPGPLAVAERDSATAGSGDDAAMAW